MNHQIGYWMQDAAGLPCFHYTGKLPYSACLLPDGTRAKLPGDPWFLLGNYQLTLFTHISGEYQLITGQRSWGRMNSGKERGTGANRSLLEILDDDRVKESISLTGKDSAAADPVCCTRIFGCGFAQYSYKIGDLSVEKNLSVKPSSTPYDGASAFLLTVTVCNQGDEKRDLGYTEAVSANYEELQFQTTPPDARTVKYVNTAFHEPENNRIGVHIKGVTADPLLFSDRKTMSKYEGFPPSLFLQSLSKDAALSVSGDELSARYIFSLEAGETKTLQIIIGYASHHGVSAFESITAEIIAGKAQENTIGSAFTEDWLKIIPALEHEKDVKLRQEMRWHAYNLEAMATYSEYYKETKIPQGTAYDYHWGCHASARDNFQHALPLVYYNPKLAKSALRYMLKRTTPQGEIRLMEIGNGYTKNEQYFTSDQQLFFFLLLSEYLRVTKDYGFLAEEVEWYPVSTQAKARVLDFVERCYIFLRDEIGTGAHGLIRLLNSDWNDAVYYIAPVPYNSVVFRGESHMNSAMAISILQVLIPQLQKAGSMPEIQSLKQQIERLCDSLSLYRSSILDAFMKDMGERPFPRRMYFNGKPYGEENMFLEPQGYTLMIRELSNERKKILYHEMRGRVYAGEKLGAREQQDPEFDERAFEKGSRENGGFWWALNGPVIMGVAQFDREEAMRLLKNMTFDTFSKAFPDYWSSYWSAADNLESSLMPGEGLPDQSYHYSDTPVYCAHPHAWILYCYFILNEE